jgi:transposase
MMSNDWLNDARKIPGEPMSYIRKLAVQSIVERHHSPDLVASVLGLSRSSVYEWVKKYEKGGYDELDTHDAPGAEPRITAEIDTWLKSVVLSENPTHYGYDTVLWTCHILAEIIEKTFFIKVIPATVNVHLKELGLSYQEPCYRATERDAAEIEYFLNEKFPRIQRLASKIGADIAYEDEAGVDMSERTGRTWGLVGKTPEVMVTGQRGRLNVISLVTKDGQMEYDVTQGHIDSETFIDFLDKVLSGRDRPLIILVDRAAFHHSRKVHDYVRNNRAKIRIYFLPKYAPDYNPMEQGWEEIKDNHIRKQPVYGRDDLKKRLLSALESLKNNSQRIRSFFQLPHTSYASAPRICPDN